MKGGSATSGLTLQGQPTVDACVKWSLSLKYKLGLLAGIPVLGAVVLAGFIAVNASRESEKAKALGSIENLGELSRLMTGVLEQLQKERAIVALASGLRRAALERDDAAPGGRGLHDARVSASQVATDEARARLEAFVRSRDVAQLPPRLAENLGAALDGIHDLGSFRANLEHEPGLLPDTLVRYGAPTHALIAATAGLTELSDDGQLLRLVTSLVASLEVAERGSAQHALLGYVTASGSFPPGAYRTIVQLVTEEETHRATLRTAIMASDAAGVANAVTGGAAPVSQRLRETVLDATDDTISLDAELWFETQARYVGQVLALSKGFADRVRAAAVSKRAQVQRAITVSFSLTSFVVVGSLLLAWFIARGVTRNLRLLEDASKRVGAGKFDTKVTIQSHDELQALGETFNTMMTQLTEAKSALKEQVRMASELELAANLQRDLLPPTPTHPEFEFAGVMIPADEVGGDFYDVLTDANHQALWITVGDVSNHGLSAGLVMLMAQSAFASQFHSRERIEPDEVFACVNRVLRENVVHRLRDDKYVTAQLLCYRGAGRFVCAGGHEWPVVYRKAQNTTEVVEAVGPWLAIVPDLPEVEVSELTLEVGDVLCLYSDGLTESKNDRGELFDVERLAQALRAGLERFPHLPEVANFVVDQVRAYCSLQDDDWTLLLVRRRALDVVTQ